VETLEERSCPSVAIVFDYSRDTTGFFTSPQARQTLELAGQLLGAHLSDQLAAINPAGGNAWTATFQDPVSRLNVTVDNLNVPANTLVVFAGGHNYGGNTVGEGGFGGWSAAGSNAWLSLVSTRGQSGAAANPPTDFGPWGGSVSFDTATNWYFGDATGTPGPAQTDFLAVAMHEIGHILGIGTAPSWFARVSGTSFLGAATSAVEGGFAPQVTPGGSHWAQTDLDPTQGQPDMTPIIQTGVRKLFTNLDYAALKDIGWQVDGSNTPVSSPANPVSVPPIVAPPIPGSQTVGMFDPATANWYLRATNSPGVPDAGQFQYGAPGWSPVVGDWTGSGRQTIGVVDPQTATWYLRNSNSAGAPDIAFQYGAPGWIPLVGDWNGAGKMTVGMYDPSTARWYLRNSNSSGAPDAASFQYGLPGWLPVVGDWTGGGHTGIGLFDPSTATWYLRTEVSAGAPNAGTFVYGAPGWTPVVGDWNADGRTKVGVIDPSTSAWYLRDSNTAGGPDAGQFQYGVASWKPVVGNWNGQAQAGRRAPDLSSNLPAADLAFVAGSDTTPRRTMHMAGGYCHCAFCQNAVARANAAANQAPVVPPAAASASPWGGTAGCFSWRGSTSVVAGGDGDKGTRTVSETVRVPLSARPERLTPALELPRPAGRVAVLHLARAASVGRVQRRVRPVGACGLARLVGA
jgi:hypothetical protein